MRRSSFRGGFIGFMVVGLIVMGMAGVSIAQKGPAAVNPKAKGKPGDVAKIGDIVLKAKPVSSLKGRVYAHWADNPDGEILFGIQYWNTTGPAETGNPPGRASDDRDVSIPDPLFVCCAWGFTGGPDRNNPYAGWYTPQTTVRLRVKDKALMDQITKAAQKLVAMEVKLDGRTVTGFKILSEEE